MFQQIGPTHCLRCHRDIPRDIDYTRHILECENKGLKVSDCTPECNVSYLESNRLLRRFNDMTDSTKKGRCCEKCNGFLYCLNAACECHKALCPSPDGASKDWRAEFRKGRPDPLWMPKQITNPEVTPTAFFGYKYLSPEGYKTALIHEVTDWGHIELFIERTLEETVKAEMERIAQKLDSRAEVISIGRDEYVAFREAAKIARSHGEEK